VLKVNSNERVRWRVVVALLRRERERERELYVLGGTIRERFSRRYFDEKNPRAKKRERERSRGEDFASAKSRTTNALNASSFFAR